MGLNRNNFIRFSGSFPTATTTVTAAAFGPIAFPPDADSITCLPLVDFVADPFGIDLYSFQITGQSSPGPAPEWDPVTGTLTIFRPYASVATLTLNYIFTDKAGNESNEATITVNIIAYATSWEGYPSSYTCVLDAFSNRTGYAKYDQLRLKNTGTGTPVSPLTLKANAVSDSDYIAPVYDPITCSVDTHPYCPLNVANFTNLDPSFVGGGPIANYATITKVTLQKVGDADIVHSVSIAPGASQQINVPSNSYTHIIIEYTVTGNPGTGITGVSYRWKFSTGGASPSVVGPFINTSPFDYGATTLLYPAGATIFVG